MKQSEYPRTPDGRYFVVRGRLWRTSNPRLGDEERKALVKQLMTARREVRAASGDTKRLEAARHAVDRAKVALGERGPVWWQDGTSDCNRLMVVHSPYAAWYDALSQQS